MLLNYLYKVLYISKLEYQNQFQKKKAKFWFNNLNELMVPNSLTWLNFTGGNVFYILTFLF